MKGLRVTWYGHNFFHLETRDGTSILVDPFVENGQTAKRVADFDPDLILLTHGHEDHTGSVLEFPDAHVVSNWEIAQWLEREGHANRTAMNTGGFARPRPGLSVWMAPASHSSGLDAARFENGTLGNGGNPCGFVVDDGETKVYVAGDTGLVGDMRSVIGDVMRPDVGLLPIGDLFTMGPEHAAIAVEWLGVRVAVPCHYGTFPPIEQDPEEFRRLVGAKADVQVPRVDESFEVRGGRVVTPARESREARSL